MYSVEYHPRYLTLTLIGLEGDVYSVEYHPRETHFVTGGYDKSLQLFDIATGQVRVRVGVRVWVWVGFARGNHARIYPAA